MKIVGGLIVIGGGQKPELKTMDDSSPPKPVETMSGGEQRVLALLNLGHKAEERESVRPSAPKPA